MISSEQALRKVWMSAAPLSVEKVALTDAVGRVLCKTLRTDRPVPSFDRVMMDGIAIRLSSWNKGQRAFPLAGIQAAGARPLRLKDGGSAIEVMTGAVLPAGTDCVIPYERLSIQERTAVIQEGLSLKKWQSVHRRGSDSGKGKVALRKGTCLKAPDIAVAASVGAAKLPVYRRPNISVLATGDELVMPGRSVKDYQMYLSNPYGLCAALSAYGFENAQFVHCGDDKKRMRRLIGKALRGCDVLILSGGISKGKYDYVRELLLAEGVKEVFYGVKQRPGKPLWFGRTPAHQLVFALPGNPISVLICCYQYVLPALCAMTGQTCQAVEAVCASDMMNPSPSLTYAVPVHIKPLPGRYEVEPVLFANSGDYLALAGTDGFIRIAEGQKRMKKGSSVGFTPWSPLWLAGR
jgi:molybdopterin molybdotransferase